MGTPLRVLIIEDSESDAALIVRYLSQAGFEPTHCRVETEAEMREALGQAGWELVIADYSMPRFDASRALAIFKESGQSIPFIVVSGSVGEDIAVQMMKHGAHDYLLKNSMTRFVPAVQRELREARERRERRQIEEALEASETKYRLLFESMRDALVSTEMTGRIVSFNDTFQKMVGYEPDEIRSMTYQDLTPEKWHAFERRIVETQILTRGYSEIYQKEYRRKDGTVFPVELRTFLLRDKAGAPSRMWAIVRDITERQRTEEALRESVVRYQLLFGAITDALYVLELGPDGTPGNFIAVNDVACQMLGYSRDELLRMSPQELDAPMEQQPYDRAKVTKALLARQSLSFELIQVAKNGRQIPVEIHIKGFEMGGRLAALALVRDISERKQSEETLRKSEEAFRLLFEGAQDAIFWADAATGLLLNCNKAAEELMEMPRHELVGRPQTVLHPPEMASYFASLFKLHVEQRQSSPASAILCAKSGRRVPVEIRISKTRLDNRTIIQGIFRDVSEQRLAEERKQRLAAIVDASDDAIYGTVEGIVTHWNKGAERMYGYREEEMVGKSEAVLAPADRQEELTRILKMLARGEHIERFETVRQRKSGSQFYVSLTISPIKDPNGRVLGASSIARDITEQKNAEEALHRAHDQLEQRVQERTAELAAANQRLQELDRLKSEFLATMSHELRSPLNSIIGFTGILRQGMAGAVNDEQVKQLGFVQGSAKHLLSLINDLLDLSRIEAGKVELDRDPFNFATLVAEAMENLKPLADQKQLILRADLPETGILMVGDRKRCFQVLLNLVNNAVKFTERGEVSIMARIDQERLRVCVADTGIGIKPEQMGMLFEAFRQLDGSARRVYEGTGLGLHLCRKLVSLMGGEISVESDFGKGSRFTILIPLQLPPLAGVTPR